MGIRVLQRYLARQIYGAVGLVLAGFLALFAFFDLIAELGNLGKGNYQVTQIFGFVLLSVPAQAYDLLPVAVLIGTLYALASLAASSEFTVMRGSGMSPLHAVRTLFRIGIAFVLATFVLGEWIAPASEQAARTLKMRALSSVIGQDLQSGLWFKDEGAFINVREAREVDVLTGLTIYQFDSAFKLKSVSAAQRARYVSDGAWNLEGVARTTFGQKGPSVERVESEVWQSALRPELLNVLLVVPDKMSIWALQRYVAHLSENRQKTDRYEIAMWRKVFYPFAALVMMVLALPFAYMETRHGMLGVKVFLGIMLGISFHMLNSLFSHLGLLGSWPPLSTAILPSVCFLLAACAMMWWVERR